MSELEDKERHDRNMKILTNRTQQMSTTTSLASSSSSSLTRSLTTMLPGLNIRPRTHQPISTHIVESTFEKTKKLSLGRGRKTKGRAFDPLSLNYIRKAPVGDEEYQPRFLEKTKSGSTVRSRGSQRSKRDERSVSKARPKTMDPDNERRREAYGPMVRIGQKPFEGKCYANITEEKSNMSYFERIQNCRKSGKGRGRKGPPMISGWDVARPLAPHTLDHLPEYNELLPQIKDYVDQFAMQDTHMSKSKGSDQEPDPSVPKYMARHGIQDLFQLMTTSLLLKKPDGVLDYLIDFTALLGTHIRNANSASASYHCHDHTTSSSHDQDSHSGQGQDSMLFRTAPNPTTPSYVRFTY